MSEYAIIKSGGKQYRVSPGDVIDVELFEGEKGPFECSDVLFYFDGKEAKLGAPFVAKATVRGEILGDVRGPKLIAYKYKKRKNYRRKRGHRQNYTRIKITELGVK
jgi:large subunit ribosomal protein L21